MKIKNFNYSLVPLYTIGDGNCLIHAVLGSCNYKYQNSNKIEKKKIAWQLRKDMAELLNVKINGKNFYQKLSRGQLEDISKDIPEVKKEYMQAHLLSKAWLTSVYLELLSIIFNINIVLVSAKEEDFYRLGDKNLLFQDRHTILINYIHQSHYESIAIEINNELKTLFHRKSEIVKSLRKIL